MATAKISGPNLAIGGTFTGPAGVWSGTLPLSNMLDLKLVNKPARCVDTAGTPSFTFQLPKKRVIKGFLLEAITMESDAEYRVTLSDNPDLSAPYYTSDWTRWNQRVYNTAALQWEDEHFWSGVAPYSLLEVYGRRLLHLLPDAVSCTYIKVEFTVPSQTTFDLGYLHVFDFLTPDVNYDWNHRRTVDLRSVVDEAISGHEVVERKIAGRGHVVEFKYLSQEEAMMLLDLAHSVDRDQPVVFIPNSDDTLNLFRDVYLAKLELKETVHLDPRHYSARLEIRRIIA